VGIVSPREAHLVSAEGTSCHLTQSLPGRWELLSAQEAPALQGWYSESYGKWTPGQTLRYHPPAAARTLETTLTLHPAQ
jgi:hypothetical protein